MHLHLMITHLPIFGTIIGLLLLLYGRRTGSYHTQMAAYTLLLVAAAGCIIAYLTGEAAEEVAENIQGIEKNMIEEHEEFAKFTLVAAIALGIGALAGAYLTWKKSQFTNAILTIVLILSLICFGMSAWTGYLGGHIRHTEIDNAVIRTENIHGEQAAISIKGS